MELLAGLTCPACGDSIPVLVNVERDYTSTTPQHSVEVDARALWAHALAHATPEPPHSE